MQIEQIIFRHQRAMLDFKDGKESQAEVELTSIINELRGGPIETRIHLCQSLLDRAGILNFVKRWEEAIDDLRECAEAADQLEMIERLPVFVNIYQQFAALYANPIATVFNPGYARQALVNLHTLDPNNWVVTATLADLAFQEGEWKTAAAGYRAVASTLGKAGWARGVATHRLSSGMAFLELNELDEAETDVSEAHTFLEKHGPPHLLGPAKIHLARIYVARGRPEDAWQLAEEGLRILESTIRGFGALLDQQRFVLDKLINYDHAFATALAKSGDEGIWRAWEVAERAKSFYLCQLVANADIDLFEGIDSIKLAKLRELEAELDQLEAQMVQANANAAESEAQFNKVSKAKEKLQADLMRANPRWGLLKEPPRLDLRTELQKLNPKWAAISYFWQHRDQGATLHIFSTTSNRRPLHATVEWSHEELQQLDQTREQLRGVLSPIAKIFPDELARKILPAEVLETLTPDQNLLISPHDKLRMLPLHAMPIGDQRLIDLRPVMYIPTLALLPFRRTGKREEQVLLMGCEQDGFGSPPLRQVPDEIHTLEKGWSQTRPAKTRNILLSSQGSPSASGLPVEKWSGFDVLHFACHGDFPEGRPFDAALRLGSDAVRTSEFFGVRLNATVISLSACALARQTREHSGIQLTGDEWLGLYLPLFYAGARGVVASLWDANSQVAALFMKEFHRALSESDNLAGSFRQAMRSVAQKPEALWANWCLVGFPN